MIIDQTTKLDGMFSVPFGMNGTTNPRDLSDQQIAGGINLRVRGGLPMPRNPFKLVINAEPGSDIPSPFIFSNNCYDLAFSENLTTGTLTANYTPAKRSFSAKQGRFQGVTKYVWGNEEYGIVVMEGRIYRFIVVGNQYYYTELTMKQIGPYLDPQAVIYFEQAENYLILQDGVSFPIIWNGMTLRYADYSIDKKPEVPMGKMMKWSNGRLWVADGRNLYAGDIQGGPTSVITFSENIYMAGGVSFQFPDEITGMVNAPQLDSATGWGELLIGTRNQFWAVNSEITDRSTWTDTLMQKVIYTDIGCDSHYSMVNVSSDVYWRWNGQIWSFRNTHLATNPYYINLLVTSMRPASVEVSNFTNKDRPDLSENCRGVYFDGRLYETCFHTEGTYGGVTAFGMVVLDFFTTLTSNGQVGAGQAPQSPVWDGLYQGICPQGFLSMNVDGENRCFVFSNDQDGQNRIWELSRDNACKYDGYPFARLPINWMLDTKAFACATPAVRKRLITLDHGYVECVGPLNVGLFYRADGDSVWHPMGQLSIITQDTQTPGATKWENYQPGHLPLVRPPTPEAGVSTDDGLPDRVGKYFQYRFQAQGHAALYWALTMAHELKDAPKGAVLMVAPQSNV